MPVLLALRAVQQDIGVVGVGVADDAVAPVDELLVVLRRYVEEAGEDVDGEVGGDFLDEVEGPLGQRRVQRGGGQATQEVGVAVDDARAELALEQTAQRAVADTVQLQDGGAGLDLVIVDFFEVDELRGGEGLGVTVDAGDVGVAGHGPEAGVGGVLGQPVHRVLVAQGVEHAPWGDAVGEVVQVGEVDVCQWHRFVHGGGRCLGRHRMAPSRHRW